jgi:hypothetical protein
MRQNTYAYAQRAIGPSLPERAELTMLWYRQWARALVKALQRGVCLAAAALEEAAGAP